MELREEQNTVKPDFRVIIAGGRDFNDYPLLKAKCDKILASKSQTHNIVVITGAARGADSLGEQYARENGYAIDGDLYEEDLVSYATSMDRSAYLLRLYVKIREK